MGTPYRLRQIWDVYLCPNESLITAKSHRAAQLELVAIPLTIDRNSWVMTFILPKCYSEKNNERKVKKQPIDNYLNKRLRNEMNRNKVKLLCS